jgi:cellulose synthase/poly-beta-1,6-N-acetylglucosamine synthase-like glycosyltransferase
LTAIAIAFWVAAGLIAYTMVGYPLALAALATFAGRRSSSPAEHSPLPDVSLIVAAHDEEASIAAFVASALAFDYPRQRLEIVVVSDGSTDRTLELAREAGADVAFEVARGGKVAALNAAVARSRGEVLAFADANAAWEPQALRRLVARLAEPEVGYVCGQLVLEGPDGENQEGLYWRYEMAIRERESLLGGITAGNGAINAIRRDAFIVLDAGRGQDISFPFELMRRGLRARYEPAAIAREAPAATLAGEFSRKRRMHAGSWSTILRHRMLSPRGYPFGYWLEVVSHRGLRYLAPFLHVVALIANAALLGHGAVYVATLAIQVAVLLAAALAPVLPLRAFRVARYYVAVTSAAALGLWDYLRGGVPVTWERAEGLR